MSVDLIGYLTSNYQGGNNIKKLMQIIETELVELEYFSIDLGNQASIDKATWGLRQYEEELGIDYNPSMAYRERREIVKAKLRGRGTTTKAMMKNTAESFSGGEVDVLEYPDEYRFVIRFVGVKGIPKNMQGFIKMIETIKPAHLIYTFEYTWLTWDEFDKYNKSWNEWDILNLTWDEFEIYKEAI